MSKEDPTNNNCHCDGLKRSYSGETQNVQKSGAVERPINISDLLY